MEGVLEPQQRAVVVEDLVTTGRSALSTADGLREAGAVVSHSVAIFTYNLDAAAQGFAEANMELLVASNISTLLEEAKDMGSITQQELRRSANSPGVIQQPEHASLRGESFKYLLPSHRTAGRR